MKSESDSKPGEARATETAAGPACRLCANTGLRPLYGSLHTVIGVQFARCSECHLIQIPQDAGTKTREQAFYENTYYSLAHKQHEGPSRTGLFPSLLRFMRRHGAHSGRLLDVGAGTGEFVRAAADNGWHAEGIEPSGEAVQRGCEWYGVSLCRGTIEDMDDAPQYDAVTLWNVLDQVDDPLAIASKAARVLRPGGVLAIRVPNGTFHHALRSSVAHFPQFVAKRKLADVFSVHLFSFTPSILQRLLLRAGFADLTIRNSPVTRGDATAVLDGRQLRFLNALKLGAFAGSELVRVASFGQFTIAPSIIALATKTQGSSRGKERHVNAP